MPTTPQPLTVQRMQEIAESPEFIASARAVLLAQAYAETKQKQVDEYVLPIFARYKFTVGEQRATPNGPTGSPIKTPGSLYLCTDEAKCDAFYAEVAAAHAAHGESRSAEGYWPDSVAKGVLIEAQSNLLDHALPQIAPGVERCDLTLEQTQAMLNLLLGVAVHAATPEKLGVEKFMSDTAEQIAVAEQAPRPRMKF